MRRQHTTRNNDPACADYLELFVTCDHHSLDNAQTDLLRMAVTHGRAGKGTFTFYAGHDPEDHKHHVHDPPTNLALHPNSPGYRLILNNVLFPAAKKKERKT